MDEHAKEVFRRKYRAQRFDSADRSDALAEEARQRLIGVFLDSDTGAAVISGDDAAAVIAGLLVGIACIAAAGMPATDENHAAIRAGLHQLAPWAVDMMRSLSGLPPLPEA